MPGSVPAIEGLPRYTTWGAVPAELLTKTQLAQQDPPLKPGGNPVGQVLYHGNCYAPLYPLGEAVPKRGATPAQRAALDRARELQHQCRRCGAHERNPLGKGRFCDPCRYAMTMWEQHDQAQALARELVADPAAVLLVVDVEPDLLPETQGVAVVAVHDRHLLYAAPAGEHGSPERCAVLDRLDSLLADRRVVEEPDHMGPSRRYPQALLLLPNSGPVVSGRDPLHPWAAHASSANASVARVWASWYGFTDHPSSTHPCIPEYGAAIPWTRSLDVAADAQSMVGLLHRIADGTEPVWERAAWTMDGYGVGEPGPARGRAALSGGRN
ncbi:hypothetical protein OHS33_38965 (plasmid) [Streptomyces sp. NBC_00536]|uniref:hypothetical protein n=1 Tax=Streptomyces sp. NBC_00536 TaxID=2975769 RepID=UPI002E81FF97|nr:hypothetical protein [Streptomyces sp. NBC_00536]WUC84340.1 hypothetical protein OHS33_38965 [Streptomyces sp. NBC_00536]